MLKIVYTKDGYAYSDYNLLEKAQALIVDYHKTSNDYTTSVSTSNIIVALRVLVKRGKISYNDIIFEFNGELIKIDEKCKLSHHPKGFVDWYDDFLDEMLDINY